jgi:hypothetical protein
LFLFAGVSMILNSLLWLILIPQLAVRPMVLVINPLLRAVSVSVLLVWPQPLATQRLDGVTHINLFILLFSLGQMPLFKPLSSAEISVQSIRRSLWFVLSSFGFCSFPSQLHVFFRLSL